MPNSKISVIVSGKKFGRRKAFPSVERLLEYFCRKNKIDKPSKSILISREIIALWENKDVVVLSEENDGNLLEESLKGHIGGDGSQMYSTQEKTYRLRGVLNGKRIELEAKRNYIRDYLMKKDSYAPRSFVPFPVPTNKIKKYIQRNDTENYWFLMKQR